jgi:hypothetical protein
MGVYRQVDVERSDGRPFPCVFFREGTMRQMNFYKQYPMMCPYEGGNFSRRRVRLLLIGESHYLPERSSQHLCAETWYAGSSETLSSEERGYIDTATLISAARAEAFANRSHRAMWGNPLKEINEHGPRYEDYRRVADDIAFYNFFLRPAIKGKSLTVSDSDVEFANRAFHIHYDRLKPTAVVFLSTLARRHLHLSKPLGVPVITTPHPGCVWWNRKATKYDGKRGRDILADYLKTMKWRQGLDCR